MVCLAFSGELDTSVIASWLIEKRFELVCFIADVGQDEDFSSIRDKVLKMEAQFMLRMSEASSSKSSASQLFNAMRRMRMSIYWEHHLLDQPSPEPKSPWLRGKVVSS